MEVRQNEIDKQFVCRRRQRIFDFVAFLAVASLNLNIVGPDPGDYLFPVLLVTGILLGYLRLRDFRFPFFLRMLFLGFIFFYLISNVVGNPVIEALGHFVSNIALFCFLKLYVSSGERMRSVCLALLSGAVASSALGVAAILRMWNPTEAFFFPVFEELSGKYWALLGEPPLLALISVFLALWLLDEMLRPKLWEGYTALKVILFTLAILQIGATLSRAGWLNLVVALSCYSLIELKRGRLREKALLVAVVLIATVSGLGLVSNSDYSGFLRERIESLVDPAVYGYDETDRMTFYFTSRAIDVANDNFWGVGSGRTETLFQSEYTLTNEGAHNTYVQIMSDNGWIAFMFFVSIIVYTGLAAFRRLFKASNGASQFGFSYQVLFSGLVGLAAEGMYHDLIGWNLAWVLPSLACILLWPAMRKKCA